jgi:hypothetical protein
MQQFPNTPRPIGSYWGAVQTAEEAVPGIWIVTTASHGGFILSDERQVAMPEALRLEQHSYEEDCNWALPVLAFEEEFAGSTIATPSLIQLARDTVRCWQPDRYTAFNGEAVAENQSYVLKERAKYQRVIGQMIACSAFGGWADWVPDGMVGFVAREVTGVDHLGHASYGADEHWMLADKTRWDAMETPRPVEALGATIVDTPANPSRQKPRNAA